MHGGCNILTEKPYILGMGNRLFSPVALLLPSLSMLNPLPKLLADEPVETELSAGRWLVDLAVQGRNIWLLKTCKTSVPLMWRKNGIYQNHVLQTLSLLCFTFKYCFIILCRWSLFSHKIRCSKPNSTPPYFFSPILLIVEINSLKGKKDQDGMINTAVLIKVAENQLFIWNISYDNFVKMKTPTGLPHISCETFFAFRDFEERSLQRCISTQSIVTENIPIPLQA